MGRYALLFILMISAVCKAETSGDLFDEIFHADAEFFTAFNNCDIEKMGKMFSKELEFYHDKAGVSDYGSTLRVTKSNCSRNLGLRRDVVKDSLSVYPIKDYGAIQKGKHRFCHKENGKDDCGTFDFVHIWQHFEGDWLLVRVLSFGH